MYIAEAFDTFDKVMSESILRVVSDSLRLARVRANQRRTAAHDGAAPKVGATADNNKSARGRHT